MGRFLEGAEGGGGGCVVACEEDEGGGFVRMCVSERWYWDEEEATKRVTAGKGSGGVA